MPFSSREVNSVLSASPRYLAALEPLEASRPFQPLVSFQLCFSAYLWRLWPLPYLPCLLWFSQLSPSSPSLSSFQLAPDMKSSAPLRPSGLTSQASQAHTGRSVPWTPWTPWNLWNLWKLHSQIPGSRTLIILIQKSKKK